MKKIISVIVTAVMLVNLIPNMLLMSSAAAKCPKGHTYVEHYCKTCKKYETNYTGLAKKGSTWYYVKSGKADSSYTGMAKNDYGWWYVKDGKIDFTYTGLAKNDYGWWYMKKGALDKTYTGMAKNQYGWWYVKKGALDKTYTGMAKNDYGWWYLKNGTIDFNYTGIGKNDYGNWYIKKGKLDTSYSGTYTDKNGTKWTVTKGKAVKKTSGGGSSTKMGKYEVDPVAKNFANPIGTIKKAWILKNPDGRNLSELGLDIRVSRVELNKTVTQTFDKNVSKQIVNPKTITYKPTCSVAVINCKDSDPTHLMVTKNTAGQASTTQVLAKGVNAIIAVDNHTMEGTDLYETGRAAMIRNGSVFKNFTGTPSYKMERLIMYRDGTWKFGTLDNEEARQAVANGAWNSFRYQDIIIRDGKVTARTSSNGVYRNRTYFGQISKTKYVMMTSEYMPTLDAAQVLLAYGCKTAIQIMGGNCSQMYANNVGNTTGMTGASVKDLNKIGFLETEWLASKGLLEAKKGGGPCSHEVDVLYVK